MCYGKLRSQKLAKQQSKNLGEYTNRESNNTGNNELMPVTNVTQNENRRQNNNANTLPRVIIHPAIILHTENLVRLPNGILAGPNFIADARLLTVNGGRITADYIRNNTNFILRYEGISFPVQLSNAVTNRDDIEGIGININGNFIPDAENDTQGSLAVRLKLDACLRRAENNNN